MSLNMWPEPPKRVGNRFEYTTSERTLTFWAEGGGMYVDDSAPKPGEERVKPIMVPGWKARIAALKSYAQAIAADAHVGNSHQIAWKAQHRRAIQGLVEAMETVLRQALHQGDLTQPGVQKYYRDHVAPVHQTHLVPDTILPH
jgi:hypothetical protein